MSETKQIDRLRSAMATLLKDAANDAAIAAMYDVLGDAQNDPPDGASDGSISEDLWTTANTMMGGFRVVNNMVARLQARKDR